MMMIQPLSFRKLCCWYLVAFLSSVGRKGAVVVAAASEDQDPSSSSASTEKDDMPYLYTCDELTPGLCEMNVEQGQVEVKGINVTFWKYSPLQAEADDSTIRNKQLPVLTIHGGPSVTHNYLLPHKQLACRGRTVIFYDQAGCGQSRPTTDDDDFDLEDYPWLLDPTYYATVELPAVIEAAIGKHQPFHILGSSWGTMVSQMYMLQDDDDETRQFVQSLVLSGPISDGLGMAQAMWDPVDGTIGSLPPFIQSRIRTLEEEEAFDSDEYQGLVQLLNGFFMLRTEPPPSCFVDCFVQANMDIMVAIQGGPSQFTAHGWFAEFNMTGQLHKVNVPVLLMSGKFDIVRPSTVQVMQDALPMAETLLLTRSGHDSSLDEPGVMNDAMEDFFGRVEAGSFKGTKQNEMSDMRSVWLTSSFFFQSVVMILAMIVGYMVGASRAKGQMRSHYVSLPE